MAKNTHYAEKISFNEEQRELSRLILERNDEGKIIFCEGVAGTGKNFVTIWSCIKKKEDLKHVQLYYTRAVVGVDDEKIGFLPGEVKEKFEEYTYPLTDNLNAIARLSDGFYNENNLKAMWETTPVTFLRGRTIEQSMFIIDECQNLTAKQIETILTRIGKFSTFILLGDPNQIDNQKQQAIQKRDGQCDFEKIMCFLEAKGIPHIKLTEVRRSGMAKKVVEWFEEFKKSTN